MPIFNTKHDYNKFIKIFLYYRNATTSLKFSKFNTLPIEERNQLIKEINTKKDYFVEIVAYCLMPNHFHFLLKQVKDHGIANFTRYISSSYSHYFNIKYERKGGLFEDRFKAKRIDNDNQLLHLSRYIHLNPYSSYLIKDFKSLKEYPFSSFPEYLDHSKNSICKKNIVLDQFKDINEYEKFVLDQADYQRRLETIKHQLLE